MEIFQSGTIDFLFKKFGDNIMVTKGTPVVKNLFFGGIYVDLRGTIEAISHTTGYKI